MTATSSSYFERVHERLQKIVIADFQYEQAKTVLELRGGQFLDAVQQRYGITGRDLAKRLGVTPEWLCYCRKGKQTMSVQTALRLFQLIERLEAANKKGGLSDETLSD